MTMESRVRNCIETLTEAYSPDEPQPLKEYAALLGIYMAGISGALLVTRMCGLRLPDKLSPMDIAVLGLGTHKVSRLIALDQITSPVRAPFTEFQESTGQGEVKEIPRGNARRKFIGMLISCPYCLGVWVASAFSLGRVCAPRVTHFLAGIFALTAISDYLQRGYAASKREE